jgi:hypothetical protein
MDAMAVARGRCERVAGPPSGVGEQTSEIGMTGAGASRGRRGGRPCCPHCFGGKGASALPGREHRGVARSLEGRWGPRTRAVERQRSGVCLAGEGESVPADGSRREGDRVGSAGQSNAAKSWLPCRALRRVCDRVAPALEVSGAIE